MNCEYCESGLLEEDMNCLQCGAPIPIMEYGEPYTYEEHRRNSTVMSTCTTEGINLFTDWRIV